MSYEPHHPVQESFALKYLRSLAELKSPMCSRGARLLAKCICYNPSIRLTIRRLDNNNFEILNDKR